MLKILSLLPRQRFEEARVPLPETLDVHFCTDYSPQALEEAAKGAAGLFVPPSHPHLNLALLEKMPSLRMIQSAGAGFDSVDLNAATSLGLPVCNSPAQNTVTVAEHVLAAVICLQRQFLTADAGIKAGGYAAAREAVLKRGCLEIFGCTAGIVGLGAIGKKLAVYLRTLGATVIAHDMFWDEDFARANDIRRVELDELFRESDVVSLHCPLTDATRGLVDAARLAVMKPGAILVNAARGGVVDEAALAEALENGRLFGAAIDNFESEIPAADNPLITLSPEAAGRVLFTPHLAGVTRAAFARMLGQGMANLARALQADGPPQFTVNSVKNLRPH